MGVEESKDPKIQRIKDPNKKRKENNDSEQLSLVQFLCHSREGGNLLQITQIPDQVRNDNSRKNVIFMADQMKCPKCGGEMEEGIIGKQLQSLINWSQWRRGVPPFI